MTHQTNVKQHTLVLNPGSSNLKWAVYDELKLGLPEAIGTDTDFDIGNILTDLLSQYTLRRVVVRIVHGGQKYHHPLLVSEKNLHEFRALNNLAPLHNPVAIKMIESLLLGFSHFQIIAVFDTEFFWDLPRVAQAYGLPVALSKKYNLRRYGFHGFAHASMLDYWQKIHSKIAPHRIITVQLGSGCSMAAILNGKPIDTTMGFTPNEGLLMSTRSGDLDSCLLTWLQVREGWSPEEAEHVLNQTSGWAGMSGGIHNMAELLEDATQESQLAIELFCHRIRKTLGAYIALLGGLDGVVLSGGISENNEKMCRQLLAGMEHFGIRLYVDKPMDPSVNSLAIKDSSRLPARLTSEESQVECWIISVDEASAMLRSVKKSYFH